jgi:AraC-like DNA-binding protein
MRNQQGGVSLDDSQITNGTIHISSKSHLNLTFNLYQCGSNEIPPGGLLSIKATDTFTLVYVNQGAALLESNSIAYKMAPSHGFFSFPDLSYELKNAGDEPLHVTWLCFSGYMVENYLNRANITRTKPIFADEEGMAGEKLSRLYAAAHKLPNRYCRMVSTLYDIFSYLLDVNPTKQSDSYVDNADFFAVKAVDFIEHNYTRNISVEDIAGALGISKKHLYGVFNNTLKISPKQYLIYYRIDKACMRLQLSSQSVLEISESVGYTNQFYFAKEFKRLTGMTPSEYRRNPQPRDLFSYRTFVPTLREKYPDHSLDVPFEENILSVYSPPLPVTRKR